MRLTSEDIEKASGANAVNFALLKLERSEPKPSFKMAGPFIVKSSEVTLRKPKAWPEQVTFIGGESMWFSSFHVDRSTKDEAVSMTLSAVFTVPSMVSRVKFVRLTLQDAFEHVTGFKSWLIDNAESLKRIYDIRTGNYQLPGLVSMEESLNDERRGAW